MILDIAPGDVISVERQRYTAEDSSSFHEVDFRLDLVRITGATPAHTRWLLALQTEPYPALLQRLDQDWLAPPSVSFVHEGEIFLNIAHGSAHRVRRVRGGGRTKGRMDYAVYRANSGRVILTIGQNEQTDAWIGRTVPADAIGLPK